MLVHTDRPPEVNCQLCGKIALGGFETYKANDMQIENIAVYRCVHCDHSWLPLEEERRIDDKVAELHQARINR